MVDVTYVFDSMVNVYKCYRVTFLNRVIVEFNKLYNAEVILAKAIAWLIKYFLALTLVGHIQENPVSQPLAVLHLDNRLCKTK